MTPDEPAGAALRRRAALLLALGLAAGTAACAGGVRPAREAATAPAPADAPLPAIPEVRGPLRLAVTYPDTNALVQARDSTFVFGTTGTGDARLAINGIPVPVEPNGAFLAWLPVPRAPRYELVAVRGADTARLVRRVRLLPPIPSLAAGAPLAADTTGLQPAPGLALPPDEAVRVTVRGSADAAGSLLLPDGARRPLPRTPLEGRVGAEFATALPAALLARGATIALARGADTVRVAVPPVAPLDTAFGTVAALAPTAVGDTDRVVVARPVAAGTYKWMLLPGTRLRITGQQGAFTRVRLDPWLDVWVNAGDVERQPAGTAIPPRVVGNLRVEPAADWVDVVVPVTERPPFLVQQEGRTLVLTLYGATANTDIARFGGNDSLVRHVTWEQEADGRARYVLHLAHEPYGYLPLWRDGALVLRVRRRPTVDAARPLRGLRIVVDAGHPPAGSTGPTGLYEGDAVLAISRLVAERLAERGARVITTRTTPAAVPLGDRPIAARRADAHALVSVHLNALPDGVNPFPAHGTGTYYFHPQSAPLARDVQAALVARLGLRDLGTYYDNLALVRPTWMPAILTEGAFIMIPRQEAALRTPAYQARYADGIVEGLERYFAGLAREQAAAPVAGTTAPPRAAAPAAPAAGAAGASGGTP